MNGLRLDVSEVEATVVDFDRENEEEVVKELEGLREKPLVREDLVKL